MLGFLPRMPKARASAGISRLLARQSTLAPPRALPLAVEEIDSAETFEAISTPASDLVANGRIAKFLIDRRRPDAPVIRFVNGNFTDSSGEVPDEAKFHFFFGRAAFNVPESLGEFNQVTYFVQDKRYIAGSVHTYFLDGSTEPIYGVQFYPQDIAREQTVLEAVRIVADKITIADARLAFVPSGTQQTVAEVTDDLSALGVEVVPLDRILGSIVYLPLNVGEAWGHLRIFPTDNDELRATDIPIFDELPLDLSVVAGTMTKAVQDTNSHVNLKSKERGTPNAVLRDAGPEHPRLAPFADKPVHLVVGRDDFSIEPTTEEIVAEKLAEKLNRPLTELVWQPETELRSYAEMAAGTAREALAFNARYGGKAANLGFLTHRDVLGTVDDLGSPSAERGYNLVPAGFGVPLQAYAGLRPASAELRHPRLDREAGLRRPGRPAVPEGAGDSLGGGAARDHGRLLPAGGAAGDPGQAERGAARGGEDQGAVQRQRRGHPQLRRRRAARQLRRRHRQAGPADRVLPDRGGRRGGRRGQAQGQAEVGRAARSRACTPACGTSGRSRSGSSPGSTRPTSRWDWRSCPRTTWSPRSPRTPWWSPGC